MTPTTTSSDGVWPCPFLGFHCCPDGEVGNKGFPRLISHLKRLHFPSDERKCVLREAISTDHESYMAVEETLKVFNQWLCGKCMDLHAPSNKESGTEITEGLVLDAELLDRVFKVPITTVKCIPHGCRLAFSQALKIVLCKVVAQPDSIDAWVRLLLFPRCTLQVYRPKNRQERRPGNRKSLQQSSILKSLAMWGKDDGITTLVKSILDGSALGSFGQGGGDFLEEGATSNTNIKQCLRKVADGHFTVAVKVLSSSGVAPYCDDTIKSLEAKHPYKPPPSMPSITFSEPPIVEEIDSVFSCIKSFPKDFSNAFNLVDRSTLLHEQGDPLGPPLFALILHPLLHKIKDSCKLLLHAWYLDDGTVIGDLEEVARVPSSRVKLLGGAISRDANFISGLAIRRATNAVDLMGLLPQLHDPQSELLLLRSFMGIAKLFFGLRTCQPVHIEEVALFFNKGLRGSIENIVVCGGPFFGDLQWRLTSLPIRFGGLGFGICGMDDDYVSALACLRDTIPSFDFSGFTNKDTLPSKAQQTLANVLFSEMVKDMEVYFDMTMRQKAVFECLRAPHA
ncbi:hypothetical protein Tco_0906545 [Tanacetum coccineum]|uniref:Reverse transcriptase domain-containing protein n=1 Tax=Tanacetum coccineum TaxID=301880 RepID=A0ABQ5CH34_9ASTR